MRLLWIAIVLALFQCNAGQQETSTVDQGLIDELFTKDVPVQNKAGGNSPDIVKGTDTAPVVDDLTDKTKKPNVS